ncbi:MAG: class I SAM-dependent methyltransferase, partial [Deltaproteobacteria bacterium]|nr:class I SAM-dependent methyltransferase [Deltaproteobacteria bacterium]
MTTETKSTIQEYFNTIARRYDILNSILSFGLHHFWKRAAIRLATLQPGSTVADICGGTADLALRAANAIGSDGHVAVYDFSFEMMRAGTAKCTLAAAPAPIAFVCGDAEL